MTNKGKLREQTAELLNWNGGAYEDWHTMGEVKKQNLIARSDEFIDLIQEATLKVVGERLSRLYMSGCGIINEIQMLEAFTILKHGEMPEEVKYD